MPIRILSGTITPSPSMDMQEGTATIEFNPHKVSSDAYVTYSSQTIGASGDFSTPPAFIFSPIAINQNDYIEPKITGKEGVRQNGWVIRHNYITKEKLEVYWRGVDDTKFQGIYYMIIGEVQFQ